jgi:CheY-like chemotaxis protein
MARILVVDDHALNRTFLRSLLAHFGHEIAEAADGEDALRILREKPQDLVISDLLMPVMDGQELTRHIHADAALAATPIIFYTRPTVPARRRRSRARSACAGYCPSPASRGDHGDRARALGRPQRVQPPRPTKSPEGRETSDLEGIRELNHDLADLLGHAISVTQKQKETMSVLSTLNASLQDAESLGLRLASLVEVGIEINTQRAPSTLLDLFARASQDILSAAQSASRSRATGHRRLVQPRPAPGAGSQIIEQVGRSKAVAFAVYEGRPVLWTAHSADPSPCPLPIHRRAPSW